jgi:hypothetical protein
MTVQTLAAEIGVDPGDVEVIARWLTSDEALDDDTLELELRAMLDPAGQRTARLASACTECGRLPGPNLVLVGWHPCTCGGHATTHCRADNGGCGHTVYEPAIDPERCSDAPFGFSG